MFNVRNIIIGIIVLVLAVAVPVTIKLSQQQTQLKSKATGCVDQVDQTNQGCSNVKPEYCYCKGCLQQSDCSFVHYQPGGWLCKPSGNICSGNAVEYASPNCSSTLQCAPKSGGGGGGGVNVGLGQPDAASCFSITIDGTDIKAANSIAVSQLHHAIIKMKHPPTSGGATTKDWDSGYYLHDTGSNSALGLSAHDIHIRSGATVSGDSEFDFPVDFTPTTITGSPFDFKWRMKNSNNEEFGGECTPAISVVSAGGPGTCQGPTGTTNASGQPLFYRCIPQGTTEIGCATSGVPSNITCTVDSLCEACPNPIPIASPATPFNVGQCGLCSKDTVTNPSVNDPDCKNGTLDDIQSKCNANQVCQSTRCLDRSKFGPDQCRVCTMLPGGIPTNCTDVNDLCIGNSKGSTCTNGICGPAGAPSTATQCFLISENQNDTNSFLSCSDPGKAAAVYRTLTSGNPLTARATFSLSPANNASKNIYVRFLKIPQGTTALANCSDRATCIDEPVATITLAIPVTGCACQADNSCSSPCQFTKLTNIVYTDPISCLTPARIHNVIPNTQDKNSYCNRQRRTEGDANADGRIDIDDYLYYLTAVSGGKVPVSVNPDFDGNGDVGPNDLTIWERSRP